MKQKGFSLIELLVVIAIIATIVAMAIPNFLGARQRAQDSKTKSEMRELKNALRLYYNDFSKYPPSQAPGKLLGCGVDGAILCPCTSGGTDFAITNSTACDTLYMKQIPAKLLGTETPTMLYTRSASTDDFCLSVELNNKSDPDIAISQNRCRSACSVVTTKYYVCAD